MTTACLPSGRLHGRLTVPGSKSYTNRALVAAALAPGESALLNPLDAEDTRTLAAALRRLGARVAFERAVWLVTGPLAPPAAEEIAIDVGPAGTPARFLLALLSALPGRFILDGSERMRERPMGPLVDSLRSRGARIRALDREGFLPLRIEGGSLTGGRVSVRGDVSSQFLSALLLISPLVAGGLELDVAGPMVSAAYVTLTRRVMAAFGARAGAEGPPYRPCCYRVPGDDSAACFPMAGALITGGRVTLEGLDPDSEQPDAIFRAWAARAGGRLSWAGEDLLVEGPAGAPTALAPLDVDVDPAPDAALPLAALLAFAGGTSRLTGVARLAEKESDRLGAAVDIVRRAGAEAESQVDGSGRPALVLRGDRGHPRPARFDAHSDHRVAMAAAVLALALPSGSELDSPEVVAKSYPLFFDDWARLVVR